MVGMDSSQKIVPTLRDNLQLLATAPADDGSKQWLIFDPVQNKYYTIGYDTFEIIRHWQEGVTYEEFVARLEIDDYHIDSDGIDTFVTFLENNNLLKRYSSTDTTKLIEQKKATKHGAFKWLIHNYLFIKLPLFKPDLWLERNMPRVEIFYSTIWQYIVFTLGIIGIMVVIQRFDEFSSTFMYLFSQEGMLYYLMSLIFVKIVHEFGHAFSAKRYGAKVPSMGVAFLVLFPVLYTDCTNAYAIRSKHKRLKIVLAGMKSEIYLALIATFLWGFLPNGPLKSIAFIVATTSWITSLLVNISPFLRFDGYYALSDWTDNKNLQPRSFAMAKWFIRYYLLGLDADKPEILTSGKERFFIWYAIATWVYRFFLFLGIAVLVYYFAFKVLGIVLFIVEIVWFILLPVYKELMTWWSLRTQVSLNRRNIIFVISMIAIIVSLFVPIKSSVSMPSVVIAKKHVDIYTPKPAIIDKIYIKDKEHVKKGQNLISLSSASIEHSIKTTKYEIQQLKNELDKIASNDKVLESKFVLEENLIKKEIELKGLEQSKNSLTIKAPFDGIVLYNGHFGVSQNVGIKEPIFTLYEPKSMVVVSYCSVYDIVYLKIGSKGKFVANDGIDSIDTTTTQISDISMTYQLYPELTSMQGGPIAVRESNNKELISEESYFKIESSIDSDVSINTRIAGVHIVDSESNSIVQKYYKIIYNTIIKESAF
jgi:putative peptide zinc metalloprotease protein